MFNSDLPSFENIFNKYKDRIFGLIIRMIKKSEDAEDITQQVFIRVYRKYDSFRRESDLYTWIYRIAMNLCTDYIRRQVSGRKHGETISIDNNLEDSRVPSHENYLEQLELTAIIQEVISRMKEKYRDVIILREFEGLSY